MNPAVNALTGVATLNVSNLDPWTSGSTLTGDQFEIASSQANLSLRPWLNGGGGADHGDGVERPVGIDHLAALRAAHRPAEILIPHPQLRAAARAGHQD